MHGEWQHSILGRFTHNGNFGWIGQWHYSAFNVFSWETANEPGDQYDLVFESRSGEEPSLVEISLALSIIANQAELASLVAKTLWNDFNGQTPDSGMWWHGQLNQVRETSGEHGQILTGPENVAPLMRFQGVAICNQCNGLKEPIGVLSFAAAFEEEHGVAILTDGNRILGSCYACDLL